MKVGKSLIIAILILIGTANLIAGNDNSTRDIQQPNLQPVEMEMKTYPYQPSRSRNVPTIQFTVDPIELGETSYDYMPGSYNRNPMQLQPEFSAPNNYSADGYYVAYQRKENASSQRRIYYNYIDNNEDVSNPSPISSTNINEGFPSIAIDPVTGSPLVTWHSNTDGDAFLECSFTYDPFSIVGSPGLWSTPYNVIDNPMDEAGQFANLGEFNWPVVSIGPSPVAGKRRAHIYANFYPNSGSSEYTVEF